LICRSRPGTIGLHAGARCILYRPAGLRRTGQALRRTILSCVGSPLLASGCRVRPHPIAVLALIGATLIQAFLVPAALRSTVGEGRARNPGIGVRPVRIGVRLRRPSSAILTLVSALKLARLALELTALTLISPLRLTPKLTLILPLELAVLALLPTLLLALLLLPLAHPGALPRPLAFKAPAGRSFATFSGSLGRHNRRRQAQEQRRQQYR
jgi:hypothetical protein